MRDEYARSSENRGKNSAYINCVVQDFVRMKKQPLLYPRVMGTFYYELIFSHQSLDFI